MPKKTPTEQFRIYAPPEADPVGLCRECYEAWRDGERVGPAVVLDLEDNGTDACKTCREERAHPRSPRT